MQRLTPTAHELRQSAESMLAEIEHENRLAWRDSAMTRWLFASLEAARLEALEAAENGVSDEVKLQILTTEARTLRTTIEEIAEALEEEDDVQHSTRGTSRSRSTRQSAPKV